MPVPAWARELQVPGLLATDPAALGKVCICPPSRGARRLGDPQVLHWQAKMHCFAALAMTGFDLCRPSLAGGCWGRARLCRSGSCKIALGGYAALGAAVCPLRARAWQAPRCLCAPSCRGARVWLRVQALPRLLTPGRAGTGGASPPPGNTNSAGAWPGQKTPNARQ